MGSHFTASLTPLPAAQGETEARRGHAAPLGALGLAALQL